nr:sensor histidine kinase [Tenacibaculum finnmarkense]
MTIENRNISLTKSVPLGLIINELLTNSFKYGIQKNKENRIEIALFFKDGYFNVLVADSGAGFDEKSKTQAITKSLGLFLIKSLTKQLRGTLKRYYTDDLFVTEIKFPI